MRGFRFAFALLPFVCACAAETPYVLQWRDLPPQLVGRNIALRLPDGARLSGTVLDVQDDGLRINVRRTSQKRLYPKGDSLIPRGSVREVEVRKSGGHTWRVVGAAIMGGIGFAAGMPFIAIAGEAALGTGIIAGGTGLGYLMGWSSDEHKVRIAVEP